MISFINASCTFGNKGGIHAVNLTINEGDFVFLTGPSGAGKSTLLRLIYMDLFPDSGKVIVKNYNSKKIRDRDIPYLRRKVGMIFQDFYLLPDRNVFQNVALSLYASHYKTGQIKSRVFYMLNQVGLGHRVHYKPHQLSGGEKQRVAIARALVKEPIILLADEPTGNLDPRASLDLINLLNRLNQRGTAILVATHNYSLIKHIQDVKLIQIRDSEIESIT